MHGKAPDAGLRWGERVGFGITGSRGPRGSQRERRRPKGVVTYAETDAGDLCRQLEYLLQNYAAIKQQIGTVTIQDNVAFTADWLLGESRASSREPEDVVR